MNLVKRRLVLAGLISLSLVAVACGSDSKSSSATTPATAGEATTTAVSADVTTTAAEATTTAGETPTTAAEAAPTVDFTKLSGSLVGSGATFPKSFYDDAIATLSGIAPDLTVEYGGGGSGKGQTDLQSNVVDFAGTDGIVKAEDLPKYTGGEFVYVPTVIAPITMSYNLPSVAKLQLSAASISAIFQRQITKWNDPLIAADNPGATLPDQPSSWQCGPTRLAPRENFTKFLDAAAGPTAAERGSWERPKTRRGPPTCSAVTATVAWPRSCRPPKAPSAMSTSATQRPTIWSSHR